MTPVLIAAALLAAAPPRAPAGATNQPPTKSELKVFTAVSPMTTVLRSPAKRAKLVAPIGLSAAVRAKLVAQARAALGVTAAPAAPDPAAPLIISAAQPSSRGIRAGYDRVSVDYSAPDVALPDLVTMTAASTRAERSSIDLQLWQLPGPSLADCRFATDSTSVSFAAHFAGHVVTGPLQQGHALFVVPQPVNGWIELATPNRDFKFDVQFVDCAFTPLR